MEWLDWVEYRPTNKDEVIDKIVHDGYSFPHYNLATNSVVWRIDELQLRRDCSALQISLSDVYPCQISLF